MNKRKAVELTGGSGDVNPQWVGFSAVQGANDQFTETSFDLPVNPTMGGRANKAIVVEILRVQFIWALDATQSPSTPQRWSAHLQAGAGEGSILLSEIQTSTSTIIVDQALTIQAGAGSTVAFRDASTLYDLTDGAGHGVIVAAKNDTVGISTFNTAVSNRVTVRILYRYKEVGLTEFITLAQFQQ